MNFTWDSLKAAHTAYQKILDFVAKYPNSSEVSNKYEGKFMEAIESDLNMPRAIAVLWELLRSDESNSKKIGTLKLMDEILGLQFFENSQRVNDVPEEVRQMTRDRDRLRSERKYLVADQLRAKIEKMGYVIEDGNKRSRVLRRI